MQNNLVMTSSPHLRDHSSTQRIMQEVCLALLPAGIAGVIIFGWSALMLICVSVATCVLSEFVWEKLTKRTVTIGDWSAVVTGLLLAYNLPANAPWWLAVVGGVIAIVLVKQMFGGIGSNFMNPALAARCFLLLSFTGQMTNFSADGGLVKLVDTVSGATPLAAVKAGEKVDLLSLFLGNTQGTIGETSALAILIGAAFLLILKVIDWRIPCTYIGSFAIFVILFGGHGADGYYLLEQLLGGGLMLGAWFMATDYVTTPITKRGQLVYGVILGCLTGLFRIFGASAEGVSYAIIFGNLLIPVIERLTVPTAFGKGGVKHEK